MLVDQSPSTNKLLLIQLHQTAESHLEWCVRLVFYQRLLAAIEIDVDEQETGLDAGNVECEHACGADVEWPRAAHERVPHLNGAIPRNPDLVAQISRVARARDVYRHARDRSARHSEIFQVRDVGVSDRIEQASRCRSLKSERRNVF